MPKRIRDLTAETSPAGDDLLAIDRSGGSARSVEIDTILNRLGLGWANYRDSTYTSGSPLNANSAKVQLTNDGLGATTNTTYLPDGVSGFWNSSTNKITPSAVGDAFDLRIDMTAEPAAANDWFEIIIDIGDGSPDVPIVTRQVSLKKSGASKLSIGFPIYCLSTFLTNGGKIYLDTSSSGDNISFYDIGIFLKRDYVARS